jgi:hypothetical protein
MKRIFLALAIVAFLPSTHGFKFANNFPNDPLFTIDIPFIEEVDVGDASQGLCGGMVFVANDYYLSGKQIPQNETPPAKNTALRNDLVDRFIDSVDPPIGIIKSYLWMASDDSLAERTWDEEIPSIITDLKTKPVPLTVIYVRSVNPFDNNKNHQVLAYGVKSKTKDKIVLKIYDPCFPKRDDITYTCTKESITHSEEGNIRGFYRSFYEVKVR